MSIIQAIILGLVQGLTEFLPVSSSGHLIIFHDLIGANNSGLAFDVALHLGTLFALLLYFHKDIIHLLKGILGKNNSRRLAWLLLIATIPAVISGVLLESLAESTFRSERLVAMNLIIVGAIMMMAERFNARITKRTNLDNLSTKQAIGIGTAQAVAVIPGVSRSGGTITTGLFLGLDRVAATRFSFLLGIPITAGAIGKVLLSGDGLVLIENDRAIFAIGISTAFISGLLAIRFLLRYLAGHTLNIFAYYRISIGLLVLIASLV